MQWVELSCPGSNAVANFECESERFENTPVPETIGPDQLSSVQSQSLVGELEARETPIENDGAQ